MINVTDEIGQYGGTWRYIKTGNLFGDLDDKADCMYRQPNEIDSIPEICKTFGTTDGKVWTFELRRGAKWSDGEPMTMRDVQFAWEDLNFNTDLNPIVPAQYRDAVTGKTVKWAKVGDHTFTLTFDTPSYTLTDGRSQRGYHACRRGNWCWYAPMHFVKDFHIKYADPDDLQKKINEGGFDSWAKLNEDSTNYRSAIGIGQPTLNAWQLYERVDTQGYYARNHYFVGVDPEGNQLPYIDDRVAQRFESREVVVFRSMAGEQDQDACSSQVRELPLYMANMGEGRLQPLPLA